MAKSENLKFASPLPALPSTREREYALRFGPARVTAWHFHRLSMVCSDLFRPTRMLMSPDVAEKFEVDKLLVGGTLLAPLRVIRGENLVAWFEKGACIEPGQLVVMEVTNTGKTDATFQCCLMGKAMVEIRKKEDRPSYLGRARMSGRRS